MIDFQKGLGNIIYSCVSSGISILYSIVLTFDVSDLVAEAVVFDTFYDGYDTVEFVVVVVLDSTTGTTGGTQVAV